MKKTTTLLLALLALMLTLTSAPLAKDDSRNRGYGFLMLEEPVNPRNTAMGSAGTALGSGGFHYYNPAMPLFAGTSFAVAEFGQMPGGVNRGGFETALISHDWFAALSFHSSSVDYETRDERGFGAPASSSTTIGAIGAGYIRDNMSAAISAHMVEDRIWVESSYSAAAISAGIGYKLLDGKLNAGAAFFHGLAWSKGYGDSAKVWVNGQVPRFVRAGAAWMDTLKSFPYTVTADIAYRDEDGSVTVPIGVEVEVLPYINVRLGKRIGWDNEIMSFGIGFNIDKLSFDAAFIPTVFVDDYDIKWNMGFTYRIGSKRKTKVTMDPVVIEPVIEEESIPEPESEPEESTETTETIDVPEDAALSTDESTEESESTTTDETDESPASTEEPSEKSESTTTDEANESPAPTEEPESTANAEESTAPAEKSSEEPESTD